MSALSPYNREIIRYNGYFFKAPCEKFPKGKIDPIFVNWFAHVVDYLSDTDVARLSQTNSVLHKVIQTSFNHFDRFKLRVSSEIEKIPLGSSHFHFLTEQAQSLRAFEICKKAKLLPPTNITDFKVQVELAKSLFTRAEDLSMIRIQEALTFILDPVLSASCAEFLKGGMASLLRFILDIKTAQIQNLVKYCEGFPDTDSKKLITEFMQRMLKFRNIEANSENIDDEVSFLHSYLTDNRHLLIDSDRILSRSEYIQLSLTLYCWVLTKKISCR